jgi:HSP20 family protein
MRAPSWLGRPAAAPIRDQIYIGQNRFLHGGDHSAIYICASRISWTVTCSTEAPDSSGEPETNEEEITMLMRTDPFRELDRLSQQVFGTAARPAPMPLDAWKEGDNFLVELDLPGVEPGSIDVDVERNVLTVRAARKPRTGEGVELVAAERAYGIFSRQLILGDTLDAGNVRATYDSGVLTLRIPVAEKAKPRRIEVQAGSAARQEIDA